MQVRILSVAAVLVALALVAVVGIVSYGPAQPTSNLVQAHDDGTVHIHPTPTPTPFPALGLAGQVSLHSEVFYREQGHVLEVTTTSAQRAAAARRLDVSTMPVGTSLLNIRAGTFRPSCPIYPRWNSRFIRKI